MSDEPKWTPGPWFYVPEVSREAWRPEERKETASHDARLIAAAPELYEALVEAERWMVAPGAAGHWSDEETRQSYNNACAMLQKALAKARGEA